MTVQSIIIEPVQNASFSVRANSIDIKYICLKIPLPFILLMEEINLEKCLIILIQKSSLIRFTS